MKKTNIKNITINKLEEANLKKYFEITRLEKVDFYKINGIGNVRSKEIFDFMELIKNNYVLDNKKKYIFTKKRYIKNEGRKNYIKNKNIIDKLNGRAVIDGKIDDIYICKKWCIEKVS